MSSIGGSIRGNIVLAVDFRGINALNVVLEVIPQESFRLKDEYEGKIIYRL